MTTMLDQLEDQQLPTLYQVVATLACPAWCELPPDHERDSPAGRVHRAAVFDLGDRAHVSVAEVIFGDEAFPRTTIEVDFWARGAFSTDEAVQIWQALEHAFAVREKIVAAMASAPVSDR